MSKHIGIVACSPPGAALCYQAILTEAAATGMNPEVSMHAHPFLVYMSHIESSDWKKVADLMLSSAEKLTRAGVEFLIAPCNTIHHAFEMVSSCSPLPWLHIADEVASAARRSGYRRLALLGTRKTMEGDVYPVRLAAADIEFLVRVEQNRSALCCTELPLLFGETLTRLPLRDSTRILATAALRRTTC
jgi:aspartate racemase